MIDAGFKVQSAQMPDLIRLIELPDMVAYAGATWDWHRLHYDIDFAASQGLPRPVVDGQEVGAFLAEHVLDHLGPAACVTSIHFRLTAMILAGDTIRVTATSASVDEGAVVVDQQVLVGNRLCAKGRTWAKLGPSMPNR